jgi:hypothetical protein
MLCVETSKHCFIVIVPLNKLVPRIKYGAGSASVSGEGACPRVLLLGDKGVVMKNHITKTFAVILIPLLTLNLCLPKISSAASPLTKGDRGLSISSPLGGDGGVRGQIALAADVRTAKAQPEILATPEEDIPVEKIEKGGVSWLWIILGVVAVGGIAAAAGGNRSVSPTPPNPSQTGDIGVKW